MASLADAEDALRSTSLKANFQRLTRLLMCGGLRLLRETFDSIHSPADLPVKLSDPAIQAQLRGARLTRPQWDCLYPSSGKYGKSTNFDITLIFRLLRTICNLTPPPGPRGWDDLPNGSDHSLEADLVRIKYYRNEVYGHNKTMEISDVEFDDLWRKISEALIRIAAGISQAKKDEWKKSIDDFLVNSLTPEEERYIEELDTWYKQDMDIKTEVEQLKEEFKTLAKDIKERPAITILVLNHTIESITQAGRPQIPRAGESLGESAVPVPDQEGEEIVSHSVELPLNLLDPPTEIQIWNVILSFKKSFELFLQYLVYKLNVIVHGHDVGSLLITVECESLQILEGLWEDYRRGHLNEIVQEMLVTAEVLEKLGLDEVRLRTFISEEEYEKGKQVFMGSSDYLQRILNLEKENTGLRGKVKALEQGLQELKDYLQRISNLEKENTGLRGKVKALEQGLQELKGIKEYQQRQESKMIQLQKKNVELEKRLLASENERTVVSLRLTELQDEVRSIKRTMVHKADSEEYHVKVEHPYVGSPLYPPFLSQHRRGFGQAKVDSRRTTTARDERFWGIPVSAMTSMPTSAPSSQATPFGGGKGFCQIIINRQKHEVLFNEEAEIESVFQNINFDVHKVVCGPKDDIEVKIDSLARRDYSDKNSFVCFILSNVTKNWEIENSGGKPFNFTKLMAKFNTSECFTLKRLPKIFIIQGDQKASAHESDEPVAEKPFSVELPVGSNFLCLFVPYRKGYISTLLSVIKLHGSDRDLLYILSEAKKLFYSKNHITIPDPVHNFSGPVYLGLNW